MGGCQSSDSDEDHRHAGDGKDGSGDTALERTLLHIVRANNCPDMDVTDEIATPSDCYVVVKVLKSDGTPRHEKSPSEEQTAAAVDDELVREDQPEPVHKLGLRRNTPNPHFDVTVELEHEHDDLIEIQIWDSDLMSWDDRIGSVQIPIRNLLGYTRKHKKPKAHKVELSTGARWSRDKKGGDGGGDDAEAGAEAGEKYKDEDGHTTPARQESIQEAKERARKITAAQATMAPEKPVAVDLFLVRHGESKWNEATKSPLKLPQLVGWDHLLTKAGYEQALELRHSWQKVRKDGPSGLNAEQENAFLNAEVIYVSPLARAVETAAVALRGHPAMKKTKPVVISRHLREIKKGLHNIDSVGFVTGPKIVERCSKALSELSPDDGRAAKHVKWDYTDVKTAWWTPGFRKDTDGEANRRLKHFLHSIVLKGHKSVIAVGHSNAFKELFEMLSRKHIRLEQEDRKLENAGVVHAKLVYTRGAGDSFTLYSDEEGALNLVKPAMLFGTKLLGKDDE